MPGFDGTGPMGMGPMTGGGRGFCSPWRAGASMRRFSYPHWAPYAYPYYGAYGFGLFTPRITREQELEFLKSEAQAMRDELKELEARITQPSAKE